MDGREGNVDLVLELRSPEQQQQLDEPKEKIAAAKAALPEVDQASAALIEDLKQRGRLDDTLVVWGGEFARTVYCQGNLTDNNYGRDHHPRCFTMWMAESSAV